MEGSSSQVRLGRSPVLPQPAGSLVGQAQKHTLTLVHKGGVGTLGVRELRRGKRDKEGCVCVHKSWLQGRRSGDHLGREG